LLIFHKARRAKKDKPLQYNYKDLSVKKSHEHHSALAVFYIMARLSLRLSL
jgi:hypothetical protein